MGSTNGVLLPYPELTESADGPAALGGLANAVEDYFYDRILPAGITRWPTHHWGAGTNFPSGALVKAGDTYRHDGLGCLMAWNGTAWRQLTMSLATDGTAQAAISTSYSALLYNGFRVRNLATGTEWVWSGSGWTDPNVPMTLAYTGAANGVTTTTSTNLPALTLQRQLGGAPDIRGTSTITLPPGFWSISWDIGLSGALFNGRSFMTVSGWDQGYSRRHLAAAGEDNSGAEFTGLMSAQLPVTFTFYITATASPFNTVHTLRLIRRGPAA